MSTRSVKTVEGIVAESPQMKEVVQLSRRVAKTDCTVLIQGESGVGKDEVARLIHSNSMRNEKPFYKVDCAAIPESLLESELFGYEPGAFTGATKSGKQGMLEAANNGTIFLDEIGDLQLSLQSKLLRVLQDQTIIRVGGTKTINVNVRIMAATNKNLSECIKKGLFREDLYYRLNVVPINIPPLRERIDDILAFLVYFRELFSERYDIVRECSPEVAHTLLSYQWPGNVRELKNLIERIFVTTPYEKVRLEDLPTHVLSNEFNSSENAVSVNKIAPLKTAVKETEKQLLLKAILRYGSTRKVAKVLRVSQPTIVRKMQEYGLSLEKEQGLNIENNVDL